MLRKETHSDGEGAIELGPFTLHHHFDQGGMAQIWRGVHNTQHIPVAIKLLTGPKAQTPRFYEGFWREIQAAARLSHPNIVMVFDYGVLPKGIDVRSKGRLAPGSPYLVMEFADQGTLYSQMGELDWPGLKGFLLDLLSALAHSHARGVLHRDLKPANVLVCSDEGMGPVLKLSDFGIAHALHRWDGALVGGGPRKTHTRISGTFQYMAPEQFRGVLREFGPWTDLYSLGIMTYEMICGRHPFLVTMPFGLRAII